MTTIVGADGCKAGWVVVAQDTVDRNIAADWLSTDTLGRLPFDIMAIDVPIGLPNAGPRRADELARELLGRPRASSVFRAPTRPTLAARSQPEASRIGLATDGTGMGVQAFGILAKVRELDTLVRQNPRLARTVYEVHPEVSFAAWAGHPMRFSKKRLPGKLERQALIAEHFGANAFANLRQSLRDRRLSVPADDLADALAALWSALRIHSNTAERVPASPVLDPMGLRMHIWY